MKKEYESKAERIKEKKRPEMEKKESKAKQMKEYGKKKRKK